MEAKHPASGDELFREFSALSHRLLELVRRSPSLSAFVPDVLRLLLEHSPADAAGLHLRGAEAPFGWLGRRRRHQRFFQFDIVQEPAPLPDPAEEERFRRADPFCRQVLEGGAGAPSPWFTRTGVFHTADLLSLPSPGLRERGLPRLALRCPGMRSLAVLPLTSGEATVGFLEFARAEPGPWPALRLEFLAGLARHVGILLENKQDRRALDERLKELTCLFGIVKAAEDPGRPLETVLQSIVELLPPAWQYPDATSARLRLDGRTYVSEGFREGAWCLSAPIVSREKERGSVEVFYTRALPEEHEGPFLREERNLLEAVARQMALVAERKDGEEGKILLQEQLRHADRLATIGQMAAGIAHELNEPLSNILGFAQLAAKSPGVPEPLERDLNKIVDASLHARDIVQRVLGFSRQLPQERVSVQLNRLIEESLFLFRSRCLRMHIAIELALDPDLPPVDADPVQMSQVLVNLILNAMQAMPDGGALALRTAREQGAVRLEVGDTGRGMTGAVRERIFEPFFTTKSEEGGTGLGLSVVRDIVSAHGGRLAVESEPGRGSRFLVRLPLVPANPTEEHRGVPAA